MPNELQEIEELFNFTYKLTKEAKLLPIIVDKIHRIWINELKKKDLNAQLPLYNKYFTEINNLVELRKKSPVEFTRKHKRVVCTSDYKMHTITEEKVSRYIEITKQFLEANE